MLISKWTLTPFFTDKVVRRRGFSAELRRRRSQQLTNKLKFKLDIMEGEQTTVFWYVTVLCVFVFGPQPGYPGQVRHGSSTVPGRVFKGLLHHSLVDGFSMDISANLRELHCCHFYGDVNGIKFPSLSVHFRMDWAPNNWFMMCENSICWT